MQIDFTVPVIDNFGDMGFALSLALSMTEKDSDLTVHFYSEDEALFQKMLGESPSERIAYRELSEWRDSMGSELRFNFFGYALKDEDLRPAANLRKIINFDYLQFHRWAGPSDPGIVSLHGTKYDIGGKDIVYLVPSPLPEWAGVVIPSAPNDQEKAALSQLLEDVGKWRKLCSVFVYPQTAKLIEEAASTHPDWIFLVCGGCDISGKNVIKVPFLPIRAYGELLKMCDANIVRWENSLVSAMLAGKPFLWDIYRERNGAHNEKMRDLGIYVNQHCPWSGTLMGFMESATQGQSLERLLGTDVPEFGKLKHELSKHDIVKTIESFV
jgi:hypothetical protein